MKYLKKYKIFESSFELLKNNIMDIDDALLELKDNKWIVYIYYTPKRFENPKCNLKIDKDFITIIIKKKQNSSGNRYPINSEFKFFEIEEFIYRIVEMYKNNEVSFRIATRSSNWVEDDKLRGIFININIDDIVNYPLLAFEMKIKLDGENLDEFKYKEINTLIKY